MSVHQALGTWSFHLADGLRGQDQPEPSAACHSDGRDRLAHATGDMATHDGGMRPCFMPSLTVLGFPLMDVFGRGRHE